MAWNAISNDCDRLEYFQDIVTDNVSRLTLRAGASDYVICRYTGTVDGVYDELYALEDQCIAQCMMEGAQIGEMAGEVYCELSLALGGLERADYFIRGPVSTCGFGFETSCDFTFIRTTENYRNSLGRCRPFTRGEFEPVWNETRNNQCMYDPIFEGDSEDDGI